MVVAEAVVVEDGVSLDTLPSITTMRKRTSGLLKARMGKRGGQRDRRSTFLLRKTTRP
jgi:hypothetical protein